MARCTCDRKPSKRRTKASYRRTKASYRRTQYGDPYLDIHHVDTRTEITDSVRGTSGNDIYVFRNNGSTIELAMLRSHDRDPRWRLDQDGTVVADGLTQTEMVRLHHWTLQLFEMIGRGIPYAMLPR